MSDADQQAALSAFAEGNTLIHDALFVKAADKYREALTHWKHPAIYYNLALALVNLDKPVEMHDALEKAMAYGPAPLDQDKFDRAKGYMTLVEGQLANVELTCDQPGAKVYLDGEELFTAPGQYKGLVIVGEHTVIAKGEGFSPTQVSQKLAPRENMRLNVKLFTDEQLTREKRKMPVWVPYATAGAGALPIGYRAHGRVRRGDRRRAATPAPRRARLGSRRDRSGTARCPHRCRPRRDRLRGAPPPLRAWRRRGVAAWE